MGNNNLKQLTKEEKSMREDVLEKAKEEVGREQNITIQKPKTVSKNGSGHQCQMLQNKIKTEKHPFYLLFLSY